MTRQPLIASFDRREYSCKANSRLCWSKACEAMLLDLVRQRRLLWDPKEPLYHKNKLRQEAFSTIAKDIQDEFPELEGLNGGKYHYTYAYFNIYIYLFTIFP